MRSELGTVKEQVIEVLAKYPKTRADDFLLYAAVYMEYYGVNGNDSFVSVMRNHTAYGLPGFDSIRRCRQKVQAECAELRAPENIDTGRLDKQAEYIEFAMEG